MPCDRVKPGPEKDLLLLQKLKVPDVLDFLEPPPWLLDVKINSPPSNGPDHKELNTFLKAINRQMKTGKTSFKKSNYLPVPITLSVEIYADDLFNNPGEESESMQWSLRVDAKLTLSSSDVDDSMLDVLAAFNPQPTSYIY